MTAEGAPVNDENDDGYEYDNERDGMRAALDHARGRPTHIDEAVSLLTKDEPSMGDALDRAHEGGGKDTFGVVQSLQPKPAPPRAPDPVAPPASPESHGLYGTLDRLNDKSQPPSTTNPVLSHVTEPGAATPQKGSPTAFGEMTKNLAQHPGPATTPAERTSQAGVQTSAPSGGDDWQTPDFPPSSPPMTSLSANQVPAGPVTTARDQRMHAVELIRRLAEDFGNHAPDMLSAISGADLAAAQDRDRQQRSHDDFTKAISAGLLRQPFEPSAPTEAKDVLERQRFENGAAARTGQALSIQERLAKALTGQEKPADASLSSLRDAEAQKWRNDDVRARDAAAAKKAADDAKASTASGLREADGGSLTTAKRLWLQTSPIAKQHGLTADDLSGLTTRKDWEDFVRQAGARGGSKAAASSSQAPSIRQGDLSSIPDPGDRALVAGILDGRMGPNSVSKKDATRILKLVTQVNPDFDATAFATYAGVKKHLAESGDVVALNTAYNHLGRAAQNMPANMDAQALNRIRQAVLTGSGSDTLTPFETDVKVAADELAKAYGNNSEAGRQAVEHLLDPKQSPAQLRARLREARELLGGKLKAYQQQFANVAPKGARMNIASPDGSDGDTVTVVSRKTGRSKPMPRAAAEQLLAAPGGDAYEVQ